MNECMPPRGSGALVAEGLPLILEQPFPASLGPELIKRYASVFCTVQRVPGGRGKQRACAYLACRAEGQPTIVLYRRDRDRITVVNEYFSMDAEELVQMVRHLFDMHPEVNVILMAAVAIGPGRLSCLHQRFNASEDIVIGLPATLDAYCAALGRNTRAAIRRSQKLLAERQPAIEFHFCDRSEAGRDRVAQLVELSRQRIAGKNQQPTHTADSVADLQRMVEAYGVSLFASVEGKVCGGVICTQVGDHCYMHVVSHDPAFDDIRLGLLCCYLSIGEAIRRGAVEYHLLSGKYDYKFRLLGEQRDFDRLAIYRSPRGLLANLPVYMRTLVRGKGRVLKQQLKSWRRK